MNNPITQIIILVGVFNLTACIANNNLKAEKQPELNLLQIREAADRAYREDDLVKGEKNYAILIQASPETTEYWFRLGNIYARTNRPRAAMNVYREAVKRDPTFAKAWYNMNIVQLKQTARSLNAMLIHIDKQDPLYNKAALMLETIKAMIDKE